MADIEGINKDTSIPNRGATVDNQLVSINPTCLELRAFPAFDAIMMGWAGIFFFILMTPFMMPMIKEAVFELLSNNPEDVGLLLFLLFTMLVFYLGTTLGFSLFHVRHISKYSHVRFNRHTQKVYAVLHGRRCEADWSTIKGDINTRRSMGGGVIAHQTTLNLHLHEIDQPPKYPKLKLKAMIKNSFVNGTAESGAECLWEFIRLYMQNGPDDLLLAKPEGYLNQDYNITLNPQQAWEQHWPWPITRETDTDGWKVAKRLLWPLKIAVFPLAFSSAVLWHYFFNAFKGGYPELWPETAEGCEEKTVTLKDLERCGDVQVRYIPYQQAVKCRDERLNNNKG